MKLLTAAILAVAACAPPPRQKADDGPVGTVLLTARDSGKTVRLRTGAQLEISLEGNLTTGYQWVREAGDTSVLAPAGDARYTPAAAEPGVVGSGGMEALPFRAAKPGRTRLVLVSRQPWQGGATSEARWAAEVVVAP